MVKETKRQYVELGEMKNKWEYFKNPLMIITIEEHPIFQQFLNTSYLTDLYIVLPSNWNLDLKSQFLA